MSREIYTNGNYIEKNPNWHIEDSLWKAHKIIRLIEKNNLHPNSICEVGCGAGGILKQLHNQMPNHVQFTGYEISPQAFNFCKQINKERLEFYLGNILEDTNSFFDLILCIDVFEHIEDYFGFLKELKKRASYKIFHIPLDISVSSVIRANPILEARKKVGHIHYFTKETALATLEDNGYEILDHFYTAGSIELTSQFQTFLAKFPRKILYGFNPDLAVRLMGGYSLLVLTR